MDEIKLEERFLWSFFCYFVAVRNAALASEQWLEVFIFVKITTQILGSESNYKVCIGSDLDHLSKLKDYLLSLTLK